MSIRNTAIATFCAGALTAGGAVAAWQAAPVAQPAAAVADDAQGQGRQGGRGRGGANRVQIAPGEECPAGMTETRPQQCTAPEFDPPSIVDYRPDSPLVTADHPVPRAKYPAVDVHGHAAGNLSSPESIAEFVATLDSIGVGVFISADNTSGDRLVETLERINATPYRDRIRMFTGIDFRDVGPGWAEKAVAQLEADVAAGAVGIGEISKSFGLRIQKPDGTRLRIDDPELDPIWAAAGRLGVPVEIHTAEPPEFFEPLDMHNERWLELALFADRRNTEPGQVTFEELMTERNNLFRRHPETTFIAAHFGWHAHDLQRAGRLLDEFPNVLLEAGAVLYDLGRQPYSGHDFFVEYQDRVLFGKDSFQPTEFPSYWRVFETRDEYFDYYRDYHAFWKMYGMDLPDEVLRKLYFDNAARVIPNMPPMPDLGSGR